MKKPNWKARFQYWFDNRMAKGTGSMVWMLSLVTALVIVILTGVEIVFHLREDGGIFSALWDSLAYTVNAEIPSSEDGTVGYILLAAAGGLVGLFFTSILIGIISSAIEEKLTDLRKGNSLVLERDHIVILGFTPGEYALLSQLLLAEEGKRTCIVVADSMERDEMERLIRENIQVPKGIRVVCRNVNICDPNSLRICAIPQCRTVVINVLKDGRTTKALLAVSAIMEREGPDRREIPVISAVSKGEAMLPRHVREKNSIIMLQTRDLVVRIIAHACTQPGLSEAFLDVFDFEGSELYLTELSGTEGVTFRELTARIDGAVPVGICHDGEVKLNPGSDESVRSGDQLLLFARNRTSARLMENVTLPHPAASRTLSLPAEATGRVVVIGCNAVLGTLLRELPESITDVVIADVTEDDRETIETLYAQPNRKLSVFPGSLSSMEELEGVVRRADFVVLLSDYRLDAEQADLHSIRLLLNLRDIKRREGLSFPVMAEMRREGNHDLVAAGDPTDFIVASNIVSMVLAQLAETPALYDVFRELLSNEGNELYLKPASAFGCAGQEYTVRELRLRALSYGYILLGYLKVRGNGRAILLNPPLEETIVLAPNDSLVVLGE